MASFATDVAAVGEKDGVEADEGVENAAALGFRDSRAAVGKAAIRGAGAAIPVLPESAGAGVRSDNKLKICLDNSCGSDGLV